MRVFPIRPYLAVGPSPETPEDIDDLKRQGVTAVVDLRFGLEPVHERLWAKNRGLFYSRFAFEDGESVDPYLLQAIIGRLHDLAVHDHHIYLHCAAGISRSPFIAVCFVAVVRQHGWDEARKQVEKANPATNIWPGFVDDYKKWREQFPVETPL